MKQSGIWWLQQGLGQMDCVEYENIRTQYAAVPTGATGTVGSANISRFAAFYFF